MPETLIRKNQRSPGRERTAFLANTHSKAALLSAEPAPMRSVVRLIGLVLFRGLILFCRLVLLGGLLLLPTFLLLSLF